MIPVEFVETLRIYKEFKLYVYYETKDWDYDDYRFSGYEFEDKTNPETGHSYGHDIVTNFQKEYEDLVDRGMYFIGCPFVIYQSTYSDRLNAYIEKNKNDLYDESHFVKTELRDTLEFEVDPLLEVETRERLSKSLFRRKEFLINKLESNGFIYDVTKDESGKIISVSRNGTKTVIEQDEAIDLSDSSLSEKIIYLKLLGVYDFLKNKQPFNMSKNALATVLSAITGENASSIQSAINPIDNITVSQKNNPLESKNKVEKIKLKLIDLGFEMKD